MLDILLGLVGGWEHVLGLYPAPPGAHTVEANMGKSLLLSTLVALLRLTLEWLNGEYASSYFVHHVYAVHHWG